MNKYPFVRDIPLGINLLKKDKFFEKEGNHPCL
jgi:hypothetical protein